MSAAVTAGQGGAQVNFSNLTSDNIAAASQTAESGLQWIRKGTLIVGSPNGPGGSTTQPALDLSAFRFTFQIRQQDAGSPNTAVIRVYNLANRTAKQIQQEFTRVVVQAGYENTNFGIIFDGTIVQTRIGRERNVDSFLDIMATEGDLPYNFSVVNQTLAPGASQKDVLAALSAVLGPYGFPVVPPPDDPASGESNDLIGGTLPRGRVLFGMAMQHLDTVAKTTGTTWVVQNGKIVMVPLTGYLPNEVPVITSQTGLVGVPQSTQQGIELTILINPKIMVGTRIQINNALVNQTQNKDGNILPSYDNPFAGAYASVVDDGFYRVIVQDFEGDSRGNPWYAKLICLALDSSAAPGQSVPLYPSGTATGGATGGGLG